MPPENQSRSWPAIVSAGGEQTGQPHTGVYARTSLGWNETSPGSARRFVADVLWARGFAKACIEQAVLLTSEAVTNAVIHARSGVDLAVLADHPMARVEVYDYKSSLTHPVVNHWPNSLASSGRGLQLIAALAEAWGVEELGEAGKCVWFEVRA